MGDQFGILRRLAWREIALRFLDSYNPMPDKAIVIANAIVEYDGNIPDTHMRYHAYEFVSKATARIEHRESTEGRNTIMQWLDKWCKDNEVA